MGKEDGCTRDKISSLKTLGKSLVNQGREHRLHQVKEEIRNIMKPIVNIDYAMVDRSDFCIMHIDKDYHMCGSYTEETIATLQKKPIIVHCKQGLFEVPNFLWGKLRHQMFFSEWWHVKQYINNLCWDDKVDDLNRWRFFDVDKIYGNHV
jgi:hypothetical protein